MAVDIKVVEGGHIVHQRAMGVYRNQYTNVLSMQHGDSHPDFYEGDGPVDDEGYVEVHPRDHVVWVG